MIIPGINLLLHSGDINQLIKNDLDSYNYTKGVVTEVSLIENTKINVNYDKSSHKLVYRYIIKSGASIDTLNETWSVNTYDLKNIVPHKEGDSIDYYKSSNNELPSLTTDRFNLNSTHKDFNGTRWFSITLSLIGLLIVILFSKQLLQNKQ